MNPRQEALQILTICERVNPSRKEVLLRHAVSCSFGRQRAVRVEGRLVRGIVRDYVLSSIHRQKADLERFIAEHVAYPDAFPLDLAKPMVAIHEIGRVQIVPQFQADYPPVDVTAGLRVALTAIAARREPARGVRTAAAPDSILGLRTFAINVELDAPWGRGRKRVRAPAAASTAYGVVRVLLDFGRHRNPE